MSDTRRVLCRWLLSTLLEKGCDPLRYAARRRWLAASASRCLTVEELRARRGPTSHFSVLPTARRAR